MSSPAFRRPKVKVSLRSQQSGVAIDKSVLTIMEQGGGVTLAKQPHLPNEQGFFHMPKLQVPNYQKPRVFVPVGMGFRPTSTEGSFTPKDPQQPQSSGMAVPNATQFSGATDLMFDGKRIRKTMLRKTVDYNTSVVKYLENRIWQRDWRDARAVQPDALYQLQVTPPSDMKHKPMNCLTSKFMRQSTNKFRCPIFCISWTPEGRRLVTGASSGEFTLWNGLTFSFETILQAHETSVRAMVWSHNDQWMVTADHAGFIKYWQSNMNNVKMYQGHKEPIRSISFCPTDSKFATCSDDGTVRVWDFLRCYEEKILRGHGADVKCVDWHPQKSLIASGSKDNQVPIKLWDPKSGQSLATLHAHKFTVMDIKWNRNGNWLLTAARDHLMKLFDIRNLKEELQVFKGHKKEATAVAWHPINEQMFASGGSDGAIMFWNAGTEKEVGAIEEAHEAIIWDLAWHPLGHVLTSASNDHSTKFWTRNRPGDAMRDKYNLNIMAVGPDGEMLDIDADVPLGENKSLLPGMGLEFGLPPESEKKVEPMEEEELPSIPGLDWSADAQYFREQAKVEERHPRKKAPYSRPIPKSFEQAWVTNQQPGTLMKDVEGNIKKGKIKSLLDLDLPARDGTDTSLVEQQNKGFNPLPPDHNPFLDDIDDQLPACDEDTHGDKDIREDQDMRDDQDLRADMDFRAADSVDSQGNFHGHQQHQQGSYRSGPPNHGCGRMGSNDGSGMGHQRQRGGTGYVRGAGRTKKISYQGNRNFCSDGSYEEMDLSDQEHNYNSGLPGVVYHVDQSQHRLKDTPMNLMDMNFNASESQDNRRNHSCSPGQMGRGRGSNRDGGGGNQDGFRGKGRGGNKRFDDRVGRDNRNDDTDTSFNEGNDSFIDSKGSYDGGFKGGNQRGSHNNFRSGDRRGGRGGRASNYRGGDNRVGGRGRRSRGRGGRGVH